MAIYRNLIQGASTVTVWDTVSIIREVATLVRAITEEVSKSMYHPLGKFPDGWCDDCSRVLGILLSDQGIENLLRVVGSRGEHGGTSHIWLKSGDLIIDITADQFTGEISSPVILTTDSPWHQGWTQSFDEIEAIDYASTEGALYEKVINSPAWIAYQDDLLSRQQRPEQ